MALHCQMNSYAQELTTNVKSCEAAMLSVTKKNKVPGFDVVLEDTVLFPEGGGQPDDRGTIDGVEVVRVTRRGADAIHFVPTPLDVGSEVTVKVDWVRRFDHMQQHSGQHLITAIINDVYQYDTTSWNLGESVSFIELDTPSLTSGQMESIERMTNDKIRSSLPMTLAVYTGVDDPKLQEARTRGLPDDHQGAVRIVTIEGVESDMCCGTHVSNLSHLQRVLNYVAMSYQRDKALTGILKGGPESHVELVEKLQKSQKVAQKTSLTLLRDVAILEGQKIKQESGDGKIFTIHKKEGDFEFMNIVINEVNDPNVVLFLTVGDEKGAGLFMFSGPEQLVNTIGPK